ncbi:uncharacterized protein LOC104904129 [Beta vulgaris subsp. vulgaris]|uniref:uncharacterized protein LOC104904129 n=1 Tax=Beta vulgaris subsp. vulgaris TaxID=3555 RepID=UPI00053FF36F|nr:uncharacterized protein LOC104904129 [Beta vulgaris subsp. vulgaris]
MGSFEKMEWSRLICNNKASPKSKFTLWMALQNRLPTADRLSKWNIPCSIRCKLCEAEDESIQHLFVTCDYATTIWKAIHSKMHWEYQACSFCEEVRKARIKARGQSCQARLYVRLFTEAVYAIWLQRNNKVFNDAVVPATELVKEIVFRTAYICPEKERTMLVD